MKIFFCIFNIGSLRWNVHCIFTTSGCSKSLRASKHMLLRMEVIPSPARGQSSQQVSSSIYFFHSCFFVRTCLTCRTQFCFGTTIFFNLFWTLMCYSSIESTIKYIFFKYLHRIIIKKNQFNVSLIVGYFRQITFNYFWIPWFFFI